MNARVRLTIVDEIMHPLLVTTHETHTVDVNDEMTMADLFRVLSTDGATWIEGRHYYPLCSTYLQHESSTIQYVVTPSGILWNPPYDAVKVVDFMRTVGENKTLFLETHINKLGRGGGGGLDVPYFIDIITMIGFAMQLWDKRQSGVWIASHIQKWIRRGKKIAPLQDTGVAAEHPVSFMSYLLSKKQWNPHALAADTGMSVESCRSFLEGCKYKYDRKTMLYVASADTPKIAEVLNTLPIGEYVYEYNKKQISVQGD